MDTTLADLDELDRLRSSAPEPESWQMGPPAEAPAPQTPEDSIILRRTAAGVDRLQALLEDEEKEGESPIDTMLRLLEDLVGTQKAIVETTRLHREETAALALRLSALEARWPAPTGAASSIASAPSPATSAATQTDSSGVH